MYRDRIMMSNIFDTARAAGCPHLEEMWDGSVISGVLDIRSANSPTLFLFFQFQDHLFRVTIRWVQFHRSSIRLKSVLRISSIGVGFT